MRHVTSLTLGLMLLLVGPGADGQDSKPAKTDVEKEAEAWGYPNAKVMSSATAAGKVAQLVMTTEDGVEAVLKHYDKKSGTSLAGDDTPPGVFDSRSEVADGKGTHALSADDSTVPVTTKQKGTPRGVTLRQLARDESKFFVTVLVTRTKDDTRTHLLVTYLMK